MERARSWLKYRFPGTTPEILFQWVNIGAQESIFNILSYFEKKTQPQDLDYMEKTLAWESSAAEIRPKFWYQVGDFRQVNNLSGPHIPHHWRTRF